MNEKHVTAHFLDELYGTIARRKGGTPEFS